MTESALFDDLPDNEQAALLSKVRNELVMVSESVERHAKEACDDEKEVKNVTQWVSNISDKIPIVRSLEKRLDIMQGLDPVMDGILQKMAEVTDNSKLRKLQKKAKKAESY